MPNKIGTVKCLLVSEGFGFTTIEDAVGDREAFILWFGNTIPPSLTSFTRVVHSMWVSVLRDAHANGLIVTVTHPNNSAEVTDLQLGAL